MRTKIKTWLAKAADAVRTAVLFVLLLPLFLAVAIFAGIRAAQEWIELWAVYRGDKDARDKDRWRNS